MKKWIVLVTLFFIGFVAKAQYGDYNGPDRYFYDEEFDWRWDIRVRISDGYNSGFLTRRESNRLYKRLEDIERKEWAYQADGYYSLWEQDEIWMDVVDLNRRIGIELSDWDRRYYGYSGIVITGRLPWYFGNSYDFYRFDHRGYGTIRVGYAPRKYYPVKHVYYSHRNNYNSHWNNRPARVVTPNRNQSSRVAEPRRVEPSRPNASRGYESSRSSGGRTNESSRMSTPRSSETARPSAGSRSSSSGREGSEIRRESSPGNSRATAPSRSNTEVRRESSENNSRTSAPSRSSSGGSQKVESRSRSNSSVSRSSESSSNRSAKTESSSSRGNGSSRGNSSRGNN